MKLSFTIETKFWAVFHQTTEYLFRMLALRDLLMKESDGET